ncbi:folylpolyglutamate synthase [Aspergillus avenaceus]|uniref:Folylpolyglutamate synthase n=1 Tax=Aspergillus avenaceus TaxID=36643 RepID=A0A5N6U7F3_ASPAV|nr:folylpolyglutamate synthase [Aspergillus avenaceus]
MKPTYENAIKLLESRMRKARPENRATFSRPDPVTATATQGLKGLPSLVGMKEWLQLLGHSDNAVNNLNIIHVTGTKGKGSTCALTRSILHAHGLRTGFPKRVGLYTSPHLLYVRERIQINDQPISEDRFTRYFYEVWDRLFGQGVENVRQPRYLQFLALLAFHTFIREEVDAAIFEVHHGGEYDATNVISRPVATGVVSLGLDHVDQLGPAIENVAWHKSGIFKSGAPAFSVPQDAGPAEVMRSRAEERGTSLTFVESDESVPRVETGILGVPVQRLNCSLALGLSRALLRQKAPDQRITPEDIARAVDSVSWPGRFEVISKGKSQWFLDGAHNTLSLGQAAQWFASNVRATGQHIPRVLIFSHISDARDGVSLMECLAKALHENDMKPEHVIFTTYQETEEGSVRFDKIMKPPLMAFPGLCETYSSLWAKFDPEASVSMEPTIEKALQRARNIGEQNGAHIFVTGSLYLVGGALAFLRS